MEFTKRQYALLERLADQFDLSLVVLFGSHATGRTTPLSDIDIGVLPATGVILTIETHLGLIGAFKELFKTEEIDVVLLDRAGPLLRYEALTKGKVLLDRDPALHGAIHLRALRDYEDTKHFRAVQFAAMSKRIHIGTFGKPL